VLLTVPPVVATGKAGFVQESEADMDQRISVIEKEKTWFPRA
jgi:hypothetical protein